MLQESRIRSAWSVMSLLLLYQHGGIGAYSFLASGESEAFGGGGFNGDIVGVGSNDIGKTLLHGGNVRIELGMLGADGSVDVSHHITFRGYEGDCLAQQYLAVYVERVGRRVGEVETNVAHVCRTQQGVADGVYEHVGIAVSEQSEGVINPYAAEPEVASLHKAVYIVAETYSDIHSLNVFICGKDP